MHVFINCIFFPLYIVDYLLELCEGVPLYGFKGGPSRDHEGKIHGLDNIIYLSIHKSGTFYKQE